MALQVTPMLSGGDKTLQYIVLGAEWGSREPNLAVYPFFGTSIGPKYSDPASLPSAGGDGLGVDVSPDGKHIATASIESPYLNAYSFSSGGFGQKLSNPSTSVLYSAQRVKFSPNGDAIAVSLSGNSDRFYVYGFSSGGFGARYSSPSTLPAGSPMDIAFSRDGDFLAFSHASSPYLTIYPFSASNGIGAKLSDPSILPNSRGFGVSFSKGGRVAVGHRSGDGISVYTIESGGVGSKFSSPATPLNGDEAFVDFSPDGDAIAIGDDSHPYVHAYEWSDSSGFGAKYSNPTNVPGGACQGVSFSRDGKSLAFSADDSTNVYVYPWSASSGFGAKISGPDVLPASGSVHDIAFGEV